MIVILSFVIMIVVSLLARYLFEKGILSPKFDVFKSFEEKEQTKRPGGPTDIVRSKEFEYENAKNKHYHTNDAPATEKPSAELQPMISQSNA